VPVRTVCIDLKSKQEKFEVFAKPGSAKEQVITSGRDVDQANRTVQHSTSYWDRAITAWQGFFRGSNNGQYQMDTPRVMRDNVSQGGESKGVAKKGNREKAGGGNFHQGHLEIGERDDVMSSDVQEYGDHASHHDKAFEALLGPTVSYHNIEDIFYKDFNFETSITSTYAENALQDDGKAPEELKSRVTAVPEKKVTIVSSKNDPEVQRKERSKDGSNNTKVSDLIRRFEVPTQEKKLGDAGWVAVRQRSAHTLTGMALAGDEESQQAGNTVYRNQYLEVNQYAQQVSLDLPEDGTTSSMATNYTTSTVEVNMGDNEPEFQATSEAPSCGFNVDTGAEKKETESCLIEEPITDHIANVTESGAASQSQSVLLSKQKSSTVHLFKRGSAHCGICAYLGPKSSCNHGPFTASSHVGPYQQGSKRPGSADAENSGDFHAQCNGNLPMEMPEYANGRGTLTKVAGSCPNVTPQFLPEMTRVAKPVFSVVVGCERKSSVENEKPGNALDACARTSEGPLPSGSVIVSKAFDTVVSDQQATASQDCMDKVVLVEPTNSKPVIDDNTLISDQLACGSTDNLLQKTSESNSDGDEQGSRIDVEAFSSTSSNSSVFYQSNAGSDVIVVEDDTHDELQPVDSPQDISSDSEDLARERSLAALKTVLELVENPSSSSFDTISEAVQQNSWEDVRFPLSAVRSLENEDCSDMRTVAVDKVLTCAYGSTFKYDGDHLETVLPALPHGTVHYEKILAKMKPTVIRTSNRAKKANVKVNRTTSRVIQPNRKSKLVKEQKSIMQSLKSKAPASPMLSRAVSHHSSVKALQKPLMAPTVVVETIRALKQCPAHAPNPVLGAISDVIEGKMSLAQAGKNIAKKAAAKLEDDKIQQSTAAVALSSFVKNFVNWASGDKNVSVVQKKKDVKQKKREKLKEPVKKRKPRPVVEMQPAVPAVKEEKFWACLGANEWQELKVTHSNDIRTVTVSESIMEGTPGESYYWLTQQVPIGMKFRINREANNRVNGNILRPNDHLALHRAVPGHRDGGLLGETGHQPRCWFGDIFAAVPREQFFSKATTAYRSLLNFPDQPRMAFFSNAITDHGVTSRQWEVRYEHPRPARRTRAFSPAAADALNAEQQVRRVRACGGLSSAISSAAPAVVMAAEPPRHTAAVHDAMPDSNTCSKLKMSSAYKQMVWNLWDSSHPDVLSDSSDL
jgi:hypothetical protein